MRRAGPEPVSPRWSTQRSVVGPGAGRRGPAGVVGLRLVQGPWVPPGTRVVHVPGSAARRPGPTGGGRGVARRLGALVVAASAAAPGGDPGALGGYRQVAPLVQQVLCQQLDPNWRESYRLVASVLGRAVRASSAVECMNSVLRMHQCRHRTLNQGMLDLKRLYWNTRAFRGGKRRGRCPYEHLGLDLPSYRFWSLLQDELIIAIDEAKAKAKGIAA